MKLRERQTQMTREFIKKAALGLFCSQGIEHTDMALIAETAGITRRTLYHHYKDKEELAAALFMENLETMFGQLVPDFDFAQPQASLEKILDKYLLLRQQSEPLLYYDAIFNVYYSTLTKNPADLPDYQRVMEAGYLELVRLDTGAMEPEERAKWLEKLFTSTHLLFGYLQKAVITARQTGVPVTEADWAEDRKFKDIIMRGVLGQNLL